MKEPCLTTFGLAVKLAIVPRGQLLRDVWGGRVPSRSQRLDVHIRWLRQKVEPNPDRPVYIQTVRMIGYRFEGP
jgi:DNA-binding response OmpR family regulator